MVRVKEQEQLKEPKNIIRTGEDICLHPNLLKLEIEKEELTAFLSDGRKTSIPINWFKKWGHKNIKPKQLEKYEIWDGKVIHFPIVDAHVGVEVFTEGLNGICPNCH